MSAVEAAAAGCGEGTVTAVGAVTANVATSETAAVGVATGDDDTGCGATAATAAGLDVAATGTTVATGVGAGVVDATAAGATAAGVEDDICDTAIVVGVRTAGVATLGAGVAAAAVFADAAVGAGDCGLVIAVRIALARLDARSGVATICDDAAAGDATAAVEVAEFAGFEADVAEPFVVPLEATVWLRLLSMDRIGCAAPTDVIDMLISKVRMTITSLLTQRQAKQRLG